MAKTLNVGDSASITRAFSASDVNLYADLSTDRNPVHLDADFAASTQFGQRIVHGMLVGSLFSALLGEQLPGNGSIYMSQNLQFKAPVYLDMAVTASVAITAIREGKPIVTLKTACVDGAGKLLVTGEAVMYVPWLKA
jgi:3-hydroxybutyryl-CoA dehydratase/enoyl-CoA hydratase